MKSSTTKLLLAVTALSALAYSPAGVLAAPTEAEKPAPSKTASVPILMPILLPDGVADAAGKIAYLRNAENGIDAIEIATGKIRWTTQIIAKPLIALKDRLIVQVPVDGQENALKIAVLDGASGKQILLSEALVLPDWVVVAAENEEIYGKEFSIKPRIHGDELFLNWQASTHYAGGAAPPREVEESARNESGGFFLVSLITGHLMPAELQPLDLGIVFQSNSLTLQKMTYVSLDKMYGLTKTGITEDKTETWLIINTIGGKIGKVKLGTNLDTFAVLNSKIFWVTSTQSQGGRMKLQTIERELKVAEIATGKILWKRALKSTTIAPLPM